MCYCFRFFLTLKLLKESFEGTPEFKGLHNPYSTLPAKEYNFRASFIFYFPTEATSVITHAETESSLWINGLMRNAVICTEKSNMLFMWRLH